MQSLQIGAIPQADASLSGASRRWVYRLFVAFFAAVIIGALPISGIFGAAADDNPYGVFEEVDDVEDTEPSGQEDDGNPVSVARVQVFLATCRTTYRPVQADAVRQPFCVSARHSLPPANGPPAGFQSNRA